MGNIVKIEEGKRQAGTQNSLTGRKDMITYVYDSQNQLIRENNLYLKQTIVYTYDNGGNIKSKTFYEYTTEDDLSGHTSTKTVTYTYNDVWKDQLISYDGKAIQYDEIGNPITYQGKTLEWTGRRLDSLTENEKAISYIYNADGLRTKKTVGNNTTEYYYSNGQLSYEKRSDCELYYIYDAEGQLAVINYVKNGTSNSYYVMVNSRGDVEALYTGQGELRVQYRYDSWGNVISGLDGEGEEISSASHIGNVNPFRYRGYYYDVETGFYYVSSRYYDPEVGRFISPEPNVDYGAFDDGAGLVGYNVYAYCANNPVMLVDYDGESVTIACVLIGAGVGLIIGAYGGSRVAKKKTLKPSDGWKYWKRVVGYGVLGTVAGGLVGYGAGALVAKYGVGTAASSITKGGGARFSSFSALKRSMGSAGKGKHWHHIVEQSQISKSGFSKYWIHNSNNVIKIDASVHAKITAYYNKVHNFTGGKTFRNWLAGKSFKEQYKWGVKVLKMYGVKVR